MKRRLFIPAAALTSLALADGPAQAQGIPVIDAANLAQTVQQVVNDITKINNQVQQIAQLRRHLESINGARHLGTVHDNPSLRNYLPAEAFRVVDAVDALGYAGLTATAKALRDQAMLYNCMDLPGPPARTDCQAALAQPYQHRGLLQDAMRSAAGRLGQIDALMNRVDATTDQKAVQELQARIGAENAMLAHELTQIQMLQAMADSDERIAASRSRERQYEMLGRPGRIADHLR